MAAIPYKFFLTFGATTFEVFPKNFFKSKFAYRKDEKFAFYQKFYDGKITFIGDDYKYIHDVDIDETLRCTELQLEVKQYCDGAYLSFFTGKFVTNDGDFDVDGCSVKVPIRPNTKYDCLQQSVKVNIIDVPTIVTARDDRGTPHDYTHCRLFEDMVDYVAKQTCGSVAGIISDFFQINPENASALNYFTGAVNRYTQLVVSAKSDIYLVTPTNPATTEYAMFITTMNELRYLFNVWWELDANNNVRIEHESWFEFGVGLDLTQSRYAEYLIKTNKYTYVKDEIPESETWVFPQQGADAVSYSSGAVGSLPDAIYELTYENECPSDEVATSSVEYRVEQFFLNLELVQLMWLTHTIPFSVSFEKKSGIFLFATVFKAGDGKYHIYGGELNLEMNMSALLHQFHIWGRPQFINIRRHFADGLGLMEQIQNRFEAPIDGGLTGVDFYTRNAKGHKLQTKITVPLCCNDIFDTTKLVRTSLGDGKVADARFDPNNNTLQLQLKYGHKTEDIIDPATLTGLKLYLNADVNVTTTGGAVSSWKDARGAPIDAVQATGANQPVHGAADAYTNRGYVEFDGLNDFLVTNAIQTMQNGIGSVFGVFKIKNNNPAAVAYLQIIGNNLASAGAWDISLAELGDNVTFNPFFLWTAIENKRLNTANLADSIILGFPPEASQYYFDTWGVFCMRRNNTQWAMSYNGTSENYDGDNAGSVALAAIAPAALPLYIGANVAGINPYAGRMGSLMVFDRIITETEKQKLILWAQDYYRINPYHYPY